MTHDTSRPKHYFAHEGLAAYEMARKATQLVAARRNRLRGLPGQAGAQLERAVVGAQTNLGAGAAAEGAERRRLFRIALSEASEAGAAIDIALDFGALSQADHALLRDTLLRLCRCLYGLAHA